MGLSRTKQSPFDVALGRNRDLLPSHPFPPKQKPLDLTVPGSEPQSAASLVLPELGTWLETKPEAPKAADLPEFAYRFPRAGRCPAFS